jgi:uncharacterized glyoxalase superfamily protein PhnB
MCSGNAHIGLTAIAPLGGSQHYFEPLLRGEPAGRGAEIVLEVPDVEACYRRIRDTYELESDLQSRPWGLTDFRLTDPDGYYIRITSA